jgi:hypothetical protein
VEDDTTNYLADYYRSGIWLFTDRNTITHQFLPNFYPPYDTPAKRKIILEILSKEWDETTLSWKQLNTTNNKSSSTLTTSSSSSTNPPTVSTMVTEYLCGTSVSEMSENVKRAISPSSKMMDEEEDEVDGFFRGEEKKSSKA